MHRNSKRQKSRVPCRNTSGKIRRSQRKYDERACWAWLLVTEMQTGAWAHRLSDGTFTVGRSPLVDIRIRHPTVSRAHATLCISEAKCVLHDLGSQNGTCLNGKRIQEANVQVGDSIQFGSIVATVVDELDDSVPIPPIGAETAKLSTDDRDRTAELTSAQRRVLDWLLQGITERQIGIELHVSTHTVHSHIKVIYKAFNVGSRAALVAKIWGAWQEL